MNAKIHYEKAKVTFNYLGKEYSGDIVCSNLETKVYWFVFDQIDIKPFGGSIEFKSVNGDLQPVEDFPESQAFIACIKASIEQHLKELCN